MNTKAKYSEYREKYRAASLEGGYIESKLYLGKEDHEKVTALAQLLGARMPILMGQLVVSGLVAMAGREPKPLEAKVPTITETTVDLDQLEQMIVQSRFPRDTGAARYRQIAFLRRLAAEMASGNRVTVHSLAKIVGSHSAQLDLLAKTMEARGVVNRIHVAGLTRSRSGNILYIREDAIEAFNAAHIAAGGKSLLPIV